MVTGPRALAAALAGADLYIHTSGDTWLKASKGAVERFRRHLNRGSAAANVYGVQAADARAVLGADQKGRAV